MDAVAIPARKLLAPNDEQKALPHENKPGEFLGSELSTQFWSPSWKSLRGQADALICAYPELGEAL